MVADALVDRTPKWKVRAFLDVCDCGELNFASLPFASLSLYCHRKTSCVPVSPTARSWRNLCKRGPSVSASVISPSRSHPPPKALVAPRISSGFQRRNLETLRPHMHTWPTTLILLGVSSVQSLPPWIYRLLGYIATAHLSFAVVTCPACDHSVVLQGPSVSAPPVSACLLSVCLGSPVDQAAAFALLDPKTVEHRAPFGCHELVHLITYGKPAMEMRFASLLVLQHDSRNLIGKRYASECPTTVLKLRDSA